MENQILVEAKKEYTKALCDRLYPDLTETFIEMYQEANKLSKGKEPLKQFQLLLKEVQNWNNNLIKNHCDAVTDSCSHFSDLLAAVFVAYVKIMSSIRISKDAKKISIPLPSNETFVHRVLVNCSKDLYDDPYIMNDVDDNKKLSTLKKRFCESIEASLTELIPIPMILETYMSKPEEGFELGGTETPDPELYVPEEGLVEEEEEEEDVDEDEGDETVEKIIGEEHVDPSPAVIPETPIDNATLDAMADPTKHSPALPTSNLTPVPIQHGLSPVPVSTPTCPPVKNEEVLFGDLH